MKKLAIERSIWINAPRERVWKAVTEPEQLGQWLLPPFLGAQLTGDGSGKLTVMMGPMAVPVAVLEDMQPPQRVVSRSLPERQLMTTYLLAEEYGGTRVTVTLTGFETLLEEGAAERLEPTGLGWERALQNLKAFVDGSELPFPEGYLASMLGFKRYGAKKYAIERSIWMAAPRERVWQAITDPEQIEQWFSPGTPWRATELQVGGRMSVYNPETDTDTYTQVIQAFDPPRNLVTRSVAEPPDFPQETTWTLSEEDGGTRLTITNAGYELAPAETRDSSIEQNAFGFGMMLDNLAAFVAGRELPFPGGF